MDHVNFFKNLFKSIRDNSRIVLQMLLIQNDKGLLKECGFLKLDIIRLNKEFENILMEQNEAY